MSTPTLSQICDAITAQLVTDGWAGLVGRIGARYLANNEDAPPRIVYILPRPGEETFEAPDFVGQRPGHTPRAFRTRVAPVEIHCAATTVYDTERLSHDLASAIHRLTYGAYQILGGGYLSEVEGAWAQFAEVYVMRVAFRQPILELPMGQSEDIATVTTVQQKSEIVNPTDGTVETDVDYP